MISTLPATSKFDNFFTDPNSTIKHPSLPCKLITISKAGTNLFTKLFYLMNCPDYGPTGSGDLRHMDSIDLSYLSNEKNFIIVVRDPRDKLTSLAKWVVTADYVEMRKDLGIYSEEDELLSNQTLEERIEFLQNPYEYEKIFEAQAKWPENIYILRFEDIIGPEFGGAAKEVQHLAVKKLTQFAHETYSDEEIERLTDDMIGGTPTFTSLQKKVGQWRSLSSQAISKIEKVYGKYITYFDYPNE